jgi:hypothetical protein
MDANKIQAAYENKNVAYVHYSILGESNWKTVFVIDYDENEMRYTTDGIWYSTIKNGEWTFDNSDDNNPAGERYGDTVMIEFKMIHGHTVVRFTSAQLFEFYGDAECNYINLFGTTFERQSVE